MSKIYYYCPTPNRPSGGVQVIYRHVELLNKAGIDAVVLHQQRLFKKAYRYSWGVGDDTKVEYFRSKSDIKTCSNDIFVFPEIALDKISISGSNSYVIFNQNCYNTFSRESKNVFTIYNNAFATLVVSQDSQEYLSFLAAGIRTVRLFLSINSALFHYQQKKKKQIAYMSRKNTSDLYQIKELLNIRGNIKNYEFIDITQKPLHEVAGILKESLLFLSSSTKEGFGLPPAEAMACGCIVLGYCGQAGREFMLPENSIPIAQEDIVTFSKSIEKVVKEYEQLPDRLDSMRSNASQFILEQYSTANEKSSLLEFWFGALRRDH